MENDASSVKQQLVESLRGAVNVVITTSQNPTKDDISAAIGLHLLLQKLDKVAEVVISQPLPSQLDFLKSDMVNTELQGQRDFVVELDQSRVEADNLKYVNEDNKLKIYITPYNGSFSEEDASFSYGEYHCDAVVGVGAHSKSDVDEKVRSEEKLAQNTQFLLINTQPQEGSDGSSLNWSEPQASSVCEMVMSMSEALGSGMLDDVIATALLTGIIDKTNHFTNPSTTPKVMTMSAQLLAAGAKQSDIIEHLSRPEKPQAVAGSQDNKPDANASAPSPGKDQPDNGFQIRKQASEGGDNQQQSQQSFNVRQDSNRNSSANDDEKGALANQAQPQAQPQPKMSQSPKTQTPENRPSSPSAEPPAQTNDSSQSNTGSAAVNSSQQIKSSPPPAQAPPPPQSQPSASQPATASSYQQQVASQGKVVEPPSADNSDAPMAAMNTEKTQPQSPAQNQSKQNPTNQNQNNQPAQTQSQPKAADQAGNNQPPQTQDKEEGLNSARRAVEQALQDPQDQQGQD